MRRAFALALAAAAALGLAACGPVQSAGAVAEASTKVDQAAAVYADAKAFAELVMPLIPADRQERIHALEAKIETGLAMARVTTDAAAQAVALATVASDIVMLRNGPD